jgi:colicin import membrane protein
MSLASDRPEFTPPPSPGRSRAIVLAILAHIVLIAALTWGVGWKRDAINAPVQAELWSTTVAQAAPALVEPTPQPQPKPEPKVEPPPPPPKPAKVVEPEPEPKIDPQIAIEKAKEEKKKLKKKKAEAKALAKKEAEEEAKEEAKEEELAKKKRALEAKKAKDAKDAKEAANDAKYEAALKAARDANLKRIQGLAGASGNESATGTAKQSTGPSAGYAGRISARLRASIVFSGANEIGGNPIATVEIRTSPDGTIVGKTLTKSSGIKAWDDAVLRAVDRAEVLPKDIDGRIPSSFSVNFGPKD